MIPNLPQFIEWTFALTTLLTLIMLVNAIRKSEVESTRKKVIPTVIIVLVWLGIQAAITLNGVYNTNTDSFPPKLVLLGILPAIVAIVVTMTSKGGKRLVDSLPLRHITWINIVRIPVELCLYWLFVNKAVPELMTFEGRNWDILSGISAPIIILLAFRNGKIKRGLLLLWNVLCLLLLLNIVTNALLSAPFPIQKFAFEQPNIAIINFPFSWLPTFIVPIVLFGHLVSIRQLIRNK
ncbi:hypothetical protein [Sphingobacterium multivorum]|uniref:hypothetical protein n=1 Tax=Sphingobacterium multivorum TaxID=28454 RepID=UPI00345E7D1E